MSISAEDKFFLAVAAFVIVALVAVVAGSIIEGYGCTKWEDTGGMSCFGGDGYMHCSKDRRCVEWGDG